MIYQVLKSNLKFANNNHELFAKFQENLEICLIYVTLSIQTMSELRRADIKQLLLTFGIIYTQRALFIKVHMKVGIL